MRICFPDELYAVQVFSDKSDRSDKSDKSDKSDGSDPIRPNQTLLGFSILLTL
mgnify:CR=1 FL=1